MESITDDTFTCTTILGTYTFHVKPSSPGCHEGSYTVNVAYHASVAPTVELKAHIGHLLEKITEAAGPLTEPDVVPFAKLEAIRDIVRAAVNQARAVVGEEPLPDRPYKSFCLFPPYPEKG